MIQLLDREITSRFGARCLPRPIADGRGNNYVAVITRRYRDILA
jgi:hypothetical protein